MERTRYLILGAGVSGLAFANFLRSNDFLILERDREIGGYCKTVVQDGFVWDYSGHFFHFKHPEIEQYLVERMPGEEIRTITKQSHILYKNHRIDFPFQKNIHQLPHAEFLECLYDLFFKEDRPARNFKEMVISRFGQGIADKFLIPYNEKLYACDLTELDVHAMGRFFPYADLPSIIKNFRHPDNASYNATFTYPRGGAIQYIRALTRDLPASSICTEEGVTSLDLASKVATTSKGRRIAFEYLISSAPFPSLLSMTGLPFQANDYRWNKVLVFNLGFDRKGWTDSHWVYFPERDIVFYRAGFYDNIFGTDRMSLYIEIGYPSAAQGLDEESLLAQTLADLRKTGIVTDHKLISYHSVLLDPAYVHITQDSSKRVEDARRILSARGIYSIGRYGGWTYCSIEDNILEARRLASDLNLLEGSALQTSHYG